MSELNILVLFRIFCQDSLNTQQFYIIAQLQVLQNLQQFCIALSALSTAKSKQ